MIPLPHSTGLEMYQIRGPQFRYQKEPQKTEPCKQKLFKMFQNRVRFSTPFWATIFGFGLRSKWNSYRARKMIDFGLSCAFLLMECVLELPVQTLLDTVNIKTRNTPGGNAPLKETPSPILFFGNRPLHQDNFLKTGPSPILFLGNKSLHQYSFFGKKTP